MSTELTLNLDDYDKIIDEGKDAFIKVGNALIAVRDGKLWQERYVSFEDYTEVRHGFTRQRASQLIQATQVMTELQPLVDKNHMPQNERQVRTLGDVADTPKAQAKVWKASVKAADKLEDGTPQVTASLIKRVAAQAKTPKKSSPAESIAIDDLLSQLRKAFDKPPLLADKLREAIEAKSKMRGGFENQRVTYLNRVDDLMALYPTDVLIADVMKIATKWEATKRQVDDTSPAAPKPVTSLKR